MGRTKIIEEKELIHLIDKFYVEVCGEKGHKLKIPDIAEYVQANGYPAFKAYTLRRCEKARKHIEDLQADEQEIMITLTTYKTFDVVEFLQEHNSKEKLTKALTSLNSYYKKVADSAATIFNNFDELEEENANLSQSLQAKTAELEHLNKKLEEMREENKKLQKEKETYKEVVDKYVYPEIANKILTDSGIANLNSEHIVDEPEVIEPDSQLPITCKMLKMFNED